MPATAPVKVTAVVAVPLHNVWFAGVVTVGVGLTVMVKVCGVPGHALADGVTVIVPAIAVVPAFVAVKAAILPVPVDARPIAVLLFVQL